MRKCGIIKYPGETIKVGDEVIITGQITMNAGLVVEGILKVEKGACLVGMKDLVISKTGKFVNNGNTVAKNIINEGSINNNLIMEAMVDVDNRGEIQNQNNMIVGNNFENLNGKSEGTNGAYFVQKYVLNANTNTFGKQVKGFFGQRKSDCARRG